MTPIYRPLPSLKVLALLCGLISLLAGCGPRGTAPPAPPAPGLVVTTVTPVAGDVPRSIVVSGSVAAWQQMSLGAELSGVRVAEVLVEVGDRVRAGQPLLRLDRRTLEVQARQADAGVAQAEAALVLAQANATRGESLVKEGLVSTSNMDQLRADLRKAEAQLTTAQADRDSARLRLGFATVSAPDDGIISARTVQPGQVVSSGTELLRLIRRGRLEWRAELAERELTRVTIGTTVEITGPAGETIEGKVRTVSPDVDPQTRTGLLYADLPNPGPLRAGMFAEGHIVLGSSPASMLPREAVVFRDGFPYVFVVQPAPGAAADSTVRQVEQRRITIGARQGDASEVLSGLKPGERVVLRGAAFLGNGDVVREVNESNATAPGPTTQAGTPVPAPGGTAR